MGLEVFRLFGFRVEGYRVWGLKLGASLIHSIGTGLQKVQPVFRA